LEYIFVPKGNYIFIQGETDARRFYGIIKGRISVRTKNPQSNFSESRDKLDSLLENDRRNSYKVIREKLVSCLFPENQNLNKKNSRKMTLMDLIKMKNQNESSWNNESIKESELIKLLFEKEVENMQLTDGMCFGEWSLLNGRPRSASAYTLEDTHLFFLEKESFDVSLSKALLKGEYEKKDFLAKRLHNIKDGSHPSLSYKFYAIYLESNEILYTELDRAKYIYFIYEGECRLAKSIDNQMTFKNKDDIINNKHKLITHLKLTKGGIAGLESIIGSQYYEYNLISSRDCTILLKINLDDYEIMNKDNVAFLKDLYNEQTKHIEKFRNKYIIHRTRSNHEFKEKFKTELDLDKENQNIEKIEKEIREMNKSKANLSKNNVKLIDYYIDRNKIKSVGNINLIKSQEKFDGNYDNNNNKNKNMLSPTFFIDNLLKYDRSNSGRKTIKSKTGNKNKNLNALKNDMTGKYKHSHTNIDSTQFNVLTTDVTSKLSFSIKPISLMDDYSPRRFMTSETLSKFKLKELERNADYDLDEIRHRNFTKYRPATLIKYEPGEKPKDTLTLSKDILKTINLWTKIKSESSSTYHSGFYNLPLLSMNKSNKNNFS